MAKYLFLFRGGSDKMAQASDTERQAHMQKWGAWMQGLAQNGTLVDGLPLSAEGKVVKNAGDTISDGPFAEGAEVVGGYLMINADNMDAAIEVSKGCPIFEYGGNTEIRETLEM